jgi:hypothetical protein
MQSMLRPYRVFLFLLLIFACSNLKAIDRSASITRICLNNNDTLANISWRMPSDLCNSYQKTDIYGRRQNDPFRLMESIPDFSIEETSVKLNSLEQSWEFYIVLHTACNGIDSFISDTIGIDISKPPINYLDSVSVDFETQKIIAGWKENNAPDVKGYRLYQFSNAVNDSIGDTDNTSFLFNDVSTESAPRITLAAYDSCNLYSAISPPHQIIRLDVQGAGPCSDSVLLNWTKYIGWGNSILNYEVHKSLNGSPYRRLYSLVQNSCEDANINYGDSVCYFIRAIRRDFSNGHSTSSSSLIKCYKRYQPQVDPDYRILNWSASESDNNMTLVRQKSENIVFGKEEVEIILDKVSVKELFNPLVQEGNMGLVLGEMPINRSTNQAYSVVLHAYDLCNQPLQRTDTALNVVLAEVSSESYGWQAYKHWGPANEQTLISSVDRFTWNTFLTLESTQTEIDIDSKPFVTEYCFRIQTTNPLYTALPYSNFSGQLTNYSNTLCLSGDFKFFIPNAIHTDGQNNKFYVEGTGINRTASELIIFNRWGEQVYRSDLSRPWTPPKSQSNFGDYFYQVSVKGFKGEKEHASGRIYVIP